METLCGNPSQSSTERHLPYEIAQLGEVQRDARPCVGE